MAAVTLPHASALILAGAGSGKTRVLTTRIAWLLATGQAGPLSILAVTFTNKAAKQMLIRLSALTPVNTRGMWVGTFHGLCNRMLRAHHRDANLPQLFQILDTQDQLSLIKRMYRAHNLDDNRYPPKQLQWFIADAKEEGLRPNMVEATDELSRRQVEHYALYDAMCQREGVVDFAELLLRSYELLAGHQGLREHYQRRFSHLLVDEFQDTNTLQYKWLRMLAGPHTAVFAVGDDDQSIYAFRGAKVANMQQFERDFATPEQPVKLIKLEQNYRSHGHILDAANALIRHNQARLGKNLWTSEGKGEPVRAFSAASDHDEAEFIVDMVKGIAADGVPHDEVALLYRSNAQSRDARARAVQRRASLIACMAACAFSNARKSSMRWPTCVSSPRPGMTAHSCVSSTFRRAASARARWRTCRMPRAGRARRYGRLRRPARCRARPGRHSPRSSS